RFIAVGIRIVVRFSLVNTGIVVALRLVGIAVLIVIHLSLVIAGVVVAGIIIVGVRIVIAEVRRAGAIIRDVIAVVFIIRVVRRPPRRKYQTEHHPRSINEGASVTIPPVVAIAVPVAMPIP